MIVLITCENEDDPIKNESTWVITTLNIDFQKLKGCWPVVSGEVGPKFKLIAALMVVIVIRSILK